MYIAFITWNYKFMPADKAEAANTEEINNYLDAEFITLEQSYLLHQVNTALRQIERMK